jgi:hypothetical protein
LCPGQLRRKDEQLNNAGGFRIALRISGLQAGCDVPVDVDFRLGMTGARRAAGTCGRFGNSVGGYNRSDGSYWRSRMIDAITRERIVIHTEGTGGPYLMVAHEQLEAVTNALRARNVAHWVDDDAISLDGEPAVAVVNLGRGADVRAVQRLLDGI